MRLLGEAMPTVPLPGSFNGAACSGAMIFLADAAAFAIADGLSADLPPGLDLAMTAT